MSETPRDLLARADRHRHTESAAEWARTKIRLGETPIMRRGVLTFRKKPDVYRECEFTAEETRAIYAALAIVRQENREAAAALEKRVTTTEATR